MVSSRQQRGPRVAEEEALSREEPAASPEEGAASPEEGAASPEERPPSATGRAWLEVDLEALRGNARHLIGLTRPGVRLLPMIKADAYGLGAGRVAAVLREEGVWGFGVATVTEGARLRREGSRERIVVFAPCAPLDAPRLLREGLEPAVTSLGACQAYAEACGRLGEPLAVHLEVDTGMGRFGLPARGVADWAPRVRRVVDGGLVRLASTFTHFHSAETDPAATREQWRLFRETVAGMRAAGLEPGLLHAANSAAVLGDPEVHADLVRPGLYLYGGGPGSPPPEPVVRVRARVLDVREVPGGTTVSYGATFTTRRPSRLATLGIGYADGFPYALSNLGTALIGGRRAPVVGTVCMDMTVVDVTEAGDVRPGAAATLLGRDGEDEIRLSELAAECGTIEYEILTGFSHRLPRVERREVAVEGTAVMGRRR